MIKKFVGVSFFSKFNWPHFLSKFCFVGANFKKFKNCAKSVIPYLVKYQLPSFKFWVNFFDQSTNKLYNQSHKAYLYIITANLMIKKPIMILKCRLSNKLLRWFFIYHAILDSNKNYYYHGSTCKY